MLEVFVVCLIKIPPLVNWTLPVPLGVISIFSLAPFVILIKPEAVLFPVLTVMS